MKFQRNSILVLILLLAAPAIFAQEATTFVIGTYYRCNEATETRADAIFKEVFAPLLQEEIDAGRLIAYGWGRHWMGGAWRRLEYMTGTNLDAMVEARQSYIGKVMGEHAESTEEFSSICSSHDDYVWASGVSSQAPAAVGRDRTAVAISTYFRCDSRENEADAIVETAFAPVLNQHIKDGRINSWNWLRHVVGGLYRRALVLDAADHKSALNYWSSFSSALGEAQPALSQRFSEICSSHTDYIWDMGAN